MIFFDAAGQDALVPLAGHPVQHHTADIYVRVEGFDTANHGGHGARGLGGVDAQDYRQAQQLSQFSGAGFSVDVDAIVKAAIAFDDGKIGVPGVRVIRSENGIAVNQEGVQIVAGPAGRKGQPAGIDIVRTLFKG